jgi:hypothetical protein
LTGPGHQDAFQEVFDLVQDYANRDGDGALEYHVKALDIVAGSWNYRFESAVPPDAREVVDGILSRYGYLIRTSGRGDIDPVSVDAVVQVALVSGIASGDLNGGLRWGTSTLFKILDAITEEKNSGEYPDLLAIDTQLVADGLTTLATTYELYRMPEGDTGSN